MKINTSSPNLKATIENASVAVEQAIDSVQSLSIDQKNEIKTAVQNANVEAAEVPNTLVYWIAVGAVAAATILVVLGGLILTGFDKSTPEFLQTTLATAVGALAGMTIPTPKSGL